MEVGSAGCLMHLSCMSSVGMLECESHCGVLCIAAEHGRQLATAMYV